MKNLTTISSFKAKALRWANQFDVCCFLDSNHYRDQYSAYDFVICAGVQAELKSSYGNAFGKLKNFKNEHKNWIFGFFGYDLKNEIENLASNHEDYLGFPDLYFFVPEYVIVCKDGQPRVLVGSESILNEIGAFGEGLEKIRVQEIKKKLFLPFNQSGKSKEKALNIQARLTKQQYLNKVSSLKEHIVRGDIYEVNFCQEFFAENAVIDPLQTFEDLNATSPTPFAGYFKFYERYILSATPERFLCKRGNKLISQPIKGTAKRSGNLVKDAVIKARLKTDLKEQTENVMIVDLVRHDLSKSAIKGTVKVEELFGIYSFTQVHQMISTISCELNPEIDPIDAIKGAFPMGSMTGAPKIQAMKLIEAFEESKRGVYSGSFGCINPNGDFDFNVIIRSILYNANNKYLSFQVGGAITYQSNAEKEYDECLLKASAILKVLGN